MEGVIFMDTTFSFGTVSKEQILKSQYIMVSISKEEVVSLNLNRVSYLFNIMKELKTNAYRKLIITFDGFDDTPEEVYEIQSIRKYMFRLFFNYPYMFYYISTFDLNMKILLACIGDVIKKVKIKDDYAQNIKDVIFRNKDILEAQFQYTLPSNVLTRMISATFAYCNEIGESNEKTIQLINELVNPNLGAMSNLDSFEYIKSLKDDLFKTFSELSKELWNTWVNKVTPKILVSESQIYFFVADNQKGLCDNIEKTKIIRQVVIGHKYTNLFVHKSDLPLCDKCGEKIALIIKKDIKKEDKVHEFFPDISEYIKRELVPLTEEYRENMPIPLNRTYDRKFCMKCKTLSNI